MILPSDAGKGTGAEMSKVGRFLASLFFLFSIPALSPAWGSTAAGTILWVIDGDSLMVQEEGQKTNVRLIGIDAPEAEDNPKAEKDASRNHDSLSAEIRKGKEAAKFLRTLVHRGEGVTLVTDVESKDKYGRLLAYVFLPDGKLLNEKIIQDGYAVPLVIRPNVRYRKQIQSDYESALNGKRGLWASPGLAEPAGVKPRWVKRRYRRKKAHPLPGPQTDVTDQGDVTDQENVSGKARQFK